MAGGDLGMDYNDQALFQHPGSGNGGKRLNKGR